VSNEISLLKKEKKSMEFSDYGYGIFHIFSKNVQSKTKKLESTTFEKKINEHNTTCELIIDNNDNYFWNVELDYFTFKFKDGCTWFYSCFLKYSGEDVNRDRISKLFSRINKIEKDKKELRKIMDDAIDNKIEFKKKKLII